jgi:hypothetical protein
MTAQVLELDLVKSNAQRAFIIGYLQGLVHRSIAHIESSEERQQIQHDLEWLMPMIEEEFFGHATVSKETSDSEL